MRFILTAAGCVLCVFFKNSKVCKLFYEALAGSIIVIFFKRPLSKMARTVKKFQPFLTIAQILNCFSSIENFAQGAHGTSVDIFDVKTLQQES